MNENHEYPLAVYGYKFHFTPEQIADQLRLGAITLLTKENKKYVRVLHKHILPNETMSDDESLGTNGMTKPTDALSQQDQSTKTIPWKSVLRHAVLPFLLVYILSALYSIFDITEELNESVDESTLVYIDIAQIRESLGEQLTFDFSQTTPENERERQNLAIKQFRVAKLRQEIRSFEGLRSMIGTGSTREVLKVGDNVNFVHLFAGVKPLGLSTFAIGIKNPETDDGEIDFIFKRRFIKWHLVDVRLPL